MRIKTQPSELVGKTFGYYKVLSIYGKDINSHVLMNCLCTNCGKIKTVRKYELLRGSKKCRVCSNRIKRIVINNLNVKGE